MQTISTVAQRGLWAMAFGLVAASQASAQGVLGRASFQSTPYTIQSWTGATVTLSNANSAQQGPKGPGRLWNYTHETIGGWNNRNYVRFYWWEFDASGVPEESIGFFFSGTPIEPTGQWQNGVEYFVRARIRFNQRIRPEASSGQTANNKWFIGNSGSGGDSRVMVHLRSGESGGACPLNQQQYPPTSHVGTRISQNITSDCAGGALRVGVWEHVQYSWRFGSPGVAAVKAWINNNDYARPTAQDLSWSDNWQVVRSQMNAGFNLGGYVSDEVEDDVTWDLMDFEIATTFDPAWSASGGGTYPQPDAPGNVRVIRASALMLFLTLPAFLLRPRGFRSRKTSSNADQHE